MFQDYILWFTLICTLFLIRDFILFFGIPKEIKHTIFDWKSFWNDVKHTKKIGKINTLIIINHEIFFPFFLVISIFILLFQQLDLPIFMWIFTTHSWIEYFFLGGFAIATFGTIFSESSADDYLIKKTDTNRMRLYICFDIVISLWTTFCVFLLSSAIWFLGIIISIVSWILIFSLWILLLTEEEFHLP